MLFLIILFLYLFLITLIFGLTLFCPFIFWGVHLILRLTFVLRSIIIFLLLFKFILFIIIVYLLLFLSFFKIQLFFSFILFILLNYFVFLIEKILFDTIDSFILTYFHWKFSLFLCSRAYNLRLSLIFLLSFQLDCKFVDEIPWCVYRFIFILFSKLRIFLLFLFFNTGFEWL